MFVRKADRHGGGFSGHNGVRIPIPDCRRNIHNHRPIILRRRRRLAWLLLWLFVLRLFLISSNSIPSSRLCFVQQIQNFMSCRMSGDHELTLLDRHQKRRR